MIINEPDVWCFSSASGASLRWEKAEKEKSGNPASWHQTDPTIPGEPQKKGPWLLGLYRGRDPTQLYRGYNKPNHCKDPH